MELFFSFLVLGAFIYCISKFFERKNKSNECTGYRVIKAEIVNAQGFVCNTLYLETHDLHAINAELTKRKKNGENCHVKASYVLKSEIS